MRENESKWLKGGLSAVGGIAGGLAGGPAGAAGGAALGGMAGTALDAYAAQNAATAMATEGMFGGPRIRPIPPGARNPPSSLPAQAAMSSRSKAEPPGSEPRPAGFMTRPAPM